jgi:hypothetical protein
MASRSRLQNIELIQSLRPWTGEAIEKHRANLIEKHLAPLCPSVESAQTFGSQQKSRKGHTFCWQRQNCFSPLFVALLYTALRQLQKHRHRTAA